MVRESYDKDKNKLRIGWVIVVIVVVITLSFVVGGHPHRRCCRHHHRRWKAHSYTSIHSPAKHYSISHIT